MKLRQLAHVVGSSAKKKMRPAGLDAEDLPALNRTVSASSEQRDGLADVFGPSKNSSAPSGTWMAPALLHSMCFPVSLALLTDVRVPIQPLGTVVTSQAWDLSVPVPGEAELELTGRVAAMTRDKTGVSVIIECSLSRDGAVCYTECTSYLDKSGKGEPAVVGQVPGLMERVPTLRQDFGTNGTGYLDVGQRSAHCSVRFGTQTGKKWAHLTGDINPIHVSKASARAFGYRSVILHGAAIDAWAARELGISGERPCRGAAAFRAPVLLPAHLELVDLGGGSFAVLEEGSGRDLVHLWYEGVSQGTNDGTAIVVPRNEGRSSSTLVTQGMCAGAATGLPRLREKIDSSVPWRKHYRGAMEEMSWFDAPERGTDCARAGLDALAELLHFSDGRTLSEAVLKKPSSGGGVIVGERRNDDEACAPALTLSIDGNVLRGQDLVDELRNWQESRRLQPGAFEALSDVIARPDMLRAEGITFVCLGAGAELSPATQLLTWGCDVAAVIRPSSSRRSGLMEAAGASVGQLYVPPEDASDLVEEPERVAGWIADLPGRLVIVDSLYAPGAAFLLAAAGADVVERLVCRARPDTTLAWIGSPTDSYRLPGDGAAGELGRGKLAKSVAGYAAVRRVRPGRVGGVYPGFVYLQGPNYAAAKRIGRWRATVERAAGRPVSYNVGPMSLTSSVTDNATLKTAYAGLARLGMPPLESEVSATLMAALLTWDVHHPAAVQHSDTFLTDKAIDCGFFSCPYEPNGLMELAVLLGAGGSVSSSVRGLFRPKKASS